MARWQITTDDQRCFETTIAYTHTHHGAQQTIPGLIYPLPPPPPPPPPQTPTTNGQTFQYFNSTEYINHDS